MYYTQPPSESIHFHCVCEQLCPWQDCADVQARLSLRWPHVREVTSHELTRFVKYDAGACKIIYILVCASVRTCDDPLESFNVPLTGTKSTFIVHVSSYVHGKTVRMCRLV